MRPPRPEDAESWHRRVFGDPDVTRFLPPRAPLPLESVREAIPRTLKHWAEHGYGLWMAESRAGGELLGHCGLRFVDEIDEVEVLYGFARDAWGHGYATEAAGAAVRFGIDEMGLERIVALAFPENLASIRV